MNADKRFAKKLKAVIEQSRAAAKKAFPGDQSAQGNFVMGWLESEAGIGDSDEN